MTIILYDPILKMALYRKHIATKLWVVEIIQQSTFEEFAREAEGISRIGVLRADDNLGQAIVATGFHNAKNGDRYMTLSRTATLSRQRYPYSSSIIFDSSWKMRIFTGRKMVERKDRLTICIFRRR